MLFKSGQVEAVFLFHNTRNAPVTTLVGFPVDILFNACQVGTFEFYEISMYAVTGMPAVGVLRRLQGDA